MSRLAHITRRDLLFSSLAGVSLAFVPTRLLEAEPDQPGRDADFYQVLEDARIAYCWQEHCRAYELYRQALKLLPQEAGPAVTAEILEDLNSLKRILREASDSLPPRLAAIKASPEDSAEHFWLGWTLSRLGRYDEAAEQFRILLNLADPSWVHGVQLEVGWHDYRRGEYAGALQWFLEVRGAGWPDEVERAFARFGASDSSQADENIILTYAALGQWQEVESETREYLRHFGRLPWAERRILKRAGSDADALYIEQQGMA